MVSFGVVIHGGGVRGHDRKHNYYTLITRLKGGFRRWVRKNLRGPSRM